MPLEFAGHLFVPTRPQSQDSQLPPADSHLQQERAWCLLKAVALNGISPDEASVLARIWSAWRNLKCQYDDATMARVHAINDAFGR